MKKSVIEVTMWLSYLLVGLQAVTSIVFIFGALGPVHAAEFFCSNVTCLIASINQANSLPGKHTIFLQPGTYTLTVVDNDTDNPNGLPSITGTIEIRQNDQLATIERDSNAPPFRLFHVAPSGDLRLYGLGLRNGLNTTPVIPPLFIPPLGGGAIYNRGSLSLEQLAIYENSSGFSTGNTTLGGAIRNDGRAVLVDTEVTSNFGEFHMFGGGGAIGNRGELTITRGLIRDNGGVSVGGIVSSGELTLSDSAVVENQSDSLSGGLLISGGVATVINTTIARNTTFTPATTAGGIFVFGFLRLINSTVAENMASGPDAAGGIQTFFGGTVEIVNTIVAQNTIGFVDNPSDCGGSNITSLGNSIIGTLSGCTIDLQATDFVGDPGLGEFAQTHYPLLPDSPAIDSGDPDACPVKDQLGLPRLGTCDVGSVEFQGGRMVVSVDVRPRSDANKINPNSSKNINVAIFSANGFDATTIDPSSVRFGATGTEAAPIHVAQRDVDGDGNRDIVVRFQIQETGIMCGDTSAVLTGQIVGGPSIIGSSPIRTVQCAN